MRRREFIKLLGGTLTFRSVAVGAQEAGRSIRLGFLVPNPRQVPAVHAVFDELGLNGFVEGQNLLVIPNGFEALGDNVDDLKGHHDFAGLIDYLDERGDRAAIGL